MKKNLDEASLVTKSKYFEISTEKKEGNYHNVITTIVSPTSRPKKKVKVDLRKSEVVRQIKHHQHESSKNRNVLAELWQTKKEFNKFSSRPDRVASNTQMRHHDLHPLNLGPSEPQLSASPSKKFIEKRVFPVHRSEIQLQQPSY